MTRPDKILTETEELSNLISDERVRVIDASWHLPTSDRDGRKEYETAHIPGAVFFDIDRISEQATDLPHMLPSSEFFAQEVGTLGVASSDQIVVYDSHGLMGAARVWWMFRTFGHKAVTVLNGGLPKWLAENRPVESGVVTLQPRRFSAQLGPESVRSLEQMILNLENKSEEVVDGRPAARFFGRMAEPRQGLRRGHIPRSRNVPFESLIDADKRTLLVNEEIRRVFEKAEVDLSKPIVTTCGSGITACVVALGLAAIGMPHVSVYDGSWAEWGRSNHLPADTL